MFTKNSLVLIVNALKFKLQRKLHYLTTPIFYVNAKPHIGHLYTVLIADAAHRYKKLKYPEENCLFMTGTDEHGLKIQRAARDHKCSELDYVNNVSNMYQQLFTQFNIQYTDFLRTTQTRHQEAVQSIWLRLAKNDHIYLGEYSGWYCPADEAFVPDNQLNALLDGSKVTTDGNKPVEFVSESNYKFRLSSFKKPLLQWLQKESIKPEKFRQIVIEWVEEESILEDISVSRSSNRVWWGVPVPGDPSQTVYVWLDALSCYLTSADFPRALAWPPQLQVIGKDILKFHAVYWPAFLLGAGLDPPRQLLCHSHWLVEGEKMSKSKGNVVDPCAEAELYTREGLRYFLLREGVPHSDGNYSSVKMQRILNSELADTLGNLLNRCTAALVNPQQVFPEFNSADHQQYCSMSGQQLLQSTEALSDAVDRVYDNFEWYKGIDAIVATLHLANGFFERQKPWELRKSPHSSAHLSAVLHVTMEVLRVCGILLQPVVPQLSGRLLDKLNVPNTQRMWADIHPLTWQRGYAPKVQLSQDKIILFQKIK